jgi:hypothetical protein
MTELIYNKTVISTPGKVVAEGGCYVSTLYCEGSLAAAQALATGTAAILIPAGFSYVTVSAAAATTGASLPAGLYHGQMLVIAVTSAAANTITFAAVATSNVAGGVTDSMAGLHSHVFFWNAVAATPAWYMVGPVAN